MDTAVPEEDAFRIDPTGPATLAAAVLEESKGVTPKDLLVSVGDNIAVQEDNYLKCVSGTPSLVIELRNLTMAALIARTM